MGEVELRCPDDSDSIVRICVVRWWMVVGGDKYQFEEFYPEEYSSFLWMTISRSWMEGNYRIMD